MWVDFCIGRNLGSPQNRFFIVVLQLSFSWKCLLLTLVKACVVHSITCLQFFCVSLALAWLPLWEEPSRPLDLGFDHVTDWLWTIGMYCVWLLECRWEEEWDNSSWRQSLQDAWHVSACLLEFLSPPWEGDALGNHGSFNRDLRVKACGANLKLTPILEPSPASWPIVDPHTINKK